MFKLMLVVLAVLAVAAAQYLPYAYNAGVVRSGYYGGYAAAPIAYGGAGVYRPAAYGAYGAYPYLG